MASASSVTELAAGPEWVEPMLATLTDERELGDDWVLERKLDGVRCLAFVRGGEVVLRSRNPPPARVPVDRTGARPLGDAIVDGEIVAVADDGAAARVPGAPAPRRCRAVGVRPALARRSGPARPAAARAARALDRRASAGPALQVSALVAGPSLRAYERACASGWEGLIAKRDDAPYRGGRSRDWLKLKCVLEQEVVVGGFTEPRGSRVGLGALLVGYYEYGALRYAGKVGTGLRHRHPARAARTARSRWRPTRRRSTSPSSRSRPGTHWVRPELVAQVGFAEWTAAGRMRQPRFLGLREDKAGDAVVRERPS